MTEFSKEDEIVAGVDGDVLVYRSAYAAQYVLHSLMADDGTLIKQSQKKRELQEFADLDPLGSLAIVSEVIIRDVATVKRSLKSVMSAIIKNTNADRAKVYLSGESNFRTKVAKMKPYKGNRSADRPEFYEYARQYVLNHYDCEVSDFCEADDLLAMNLAVQYEKSKAVMNPRACNFICCTIDKDLRTVPGWHYNIAKKTLIWITNLQAARLFYTQMLMGDTADNIGGIYGIGAIGAADRLHKAKTPMELEKIVAKVYQVHYERGNWIEPFLETGRLLHMQRHPGELWVPIHKDWIHGK